MPFVRSLYAMMSKVSSRMEMHISSKAFELEVLKKYLEILTKVERSPSFWVGCHFVEPTMVIAQEF